MFKKIISALLTLSLALGLTACNKNYSTIDGYDDIVNARKQYADLFSAHLTVTDKSTDTLTQELTFRYNQSDILVFSYFGTDGKQIYREYHDGISYSYCNDNGEWKTANEGDENYVIFSKSRKMSMCDQGMIFLKADNIESAEVKETADSKTIKFIYNAENLNSSMSAQLGLVGKLTEFSVVYTLDKYGRLVTMEQIGKASQDDKISDVDYLLKIELMNDVAEVTKPENL